MNDKFQELKDRLTSNRGIIKKKIESDDDLIHLHHILMKEYGWIPLDEFKKLPLPTISALIHFINKEKEAEAREYAKIKSKSRKR